MNGRVMLAMATVAGLGLAILYLARGRDLRAEAGRGPAWKRRLVAAALLFLATLGVIGCGRERATEHPGSAPPTAGAIPEIEPPASTSLARPAETVAGVRDQLALLNRKLDDGSIAPAAARSFALSLATALAGAIDNPATDPESLDDATILYGEVIIRTAAGTELEGNGNWKKFVAAWQTFATMPAEEMKEKKVAPDTREWELVGMEKEAGFALSEMQRANAIDFSTGQILIRGLQNLYLRTGLPFVMCYAMMYKGKNAIPRAKREALLRRFAADGTLAPAAAETAAETLDESAR